MSIVEHAERNPETRGLHESVRRSLESLGLEATWRPDRSAVGQDADGHLRVRWEGGEHSFPAQVRGTVRPSLIALAGPAPHRAILITEHVTEGVADALQRAGWAGFVDGAGNASLTAPGLAVRVTGRRPPKVQQHPTTLPFNRTGLPVTFGILVGHFRGASWTQRELSRLTGASLGSVNRVIQGLQGRYLDRDGQVSRPKPLVDAWTAAYIETQPVMWPSDRYASQAWKKATDLTRQDLPPGCLVSSELAAHRHGMSIRPSTALIYCPRDRLTDVIRAGRLRHDPEGSVALRQTFWSSDMFPDASEVPNFLIRADLLLDDDPRLEDIAREVSL